MPRIDVDERLRGEARADVDVFTDESANHVLRVFDRRCEIESTGRHRLPTAEGEELSGQRRGAVGRASDFVHRFAHGGCLSSDDVRVSGDYGDDVVEVVGHPPGEAPQRLDTFHVLNASPQRVRFGHVAGDVEDERASFRRDGAGDELDVANVAVARAVARADRLPRAREDVADILSPLVGGLDRQHLERSPEKRFFLVSMEAACRLVDRHDAFVVRIDHEHRQGSDFEDLSIAILARVQFLLRLRETPLLPIRAQQQDRRDDRGDESDGHERSKRPLERVHGAELNRWFPAEEVFLVLASEGIEDRVDDGERPKGESDDHEHRDSQRHHRDRGGERAPKDLQHRGIPL